MKKIFFTSLAALLITGIAIAQTWNGTTPGNIYYNLGNVGVSASSPKAKLHLAGISTNTVGGDGFLLSDDSTPTRAFMLRLDDTNEDFQIDRRFNNVWSNSMTIQRSTGRIGLYATSPKARLHVSGISTDVVGGDGILLSDDTTPTRAFMLRLDDTNEDFQIDRRFNNAWSNSMTIQRSTGRIGLYATSPKARLHVSGISTDVVGGDGILLSDDTTPTRAFMLRLDNTNEDFQIDRRFNNTWSNSMTIQRSTGFIGIGTSTPKSKLSVDGHIRATEVKILADINVPDYVFEPNYNLRTLRETKEYITNNKHLPEIPSAAEIGEHGIDLGDMNMRLLKKIEELTLYQIELLERLEKAEAKISKLENK